MLKKLSLSVVSLLLCFCLICNSSTFRRDTYAFAPVAVAAWVAVSLCATAAGIYFANNHSTEEYEQWCKDCVEWVENTAENGYELLDDVLSGQIFLDVAGKYMFTETGFKTLANLIVKWTQSDDYKSKYGDIKEPVFSADIFTSDEINTAFYTLQQEMALSHLGYSFDESTRSYSYYSLNSLGSTLPYEYYKFYYYIKSPGTTSGVFEKSYKDYYILIFAVIGYNSDGSYSIYDSCINKNPYDTITHYQRSIRLSSSSDSCTLEQASDEKVIYGGMTHAYSDGYLSLNSMTQAAYYINSSVFDTDEDIPAPADSPVELDEDNAVTNPQYITNVINNYGTVVEGIEGTEGTDVTYVPVYYPAYEDTGNVIGGYLPGLTAPDVLTGTEGVTGVIPGTIEGVTDVPGSGTVDDSFTDGLVSAITSAIVGQFTLPDGYWDDWFDKFKFAWESKGLSVDFSFLEREFSEIRIPDVYINWKGKECLVFESDMIYYLADSAKGYIRALIYFLLLLHDRKRIIFIIRGAIPPDGDDISNGI